MTLRSPIFRKLLGGAILLILPSILVLDYYLTRDTAHQETGHTQQKLEALARVLAGELDGIPAGELQGWTRGAARRAQVRVTVIEPDGTVAAESDRSPEGMENHAGRPEILEARSRGVGVSIRRSASVDVELCYLAVVLNGPRTAGRVLRLAYPLENLRRQIAAVRYRILVASGIAMLVAIVGAYFLARTLTARVRSLQEFAGGLVASRFESSIPPQPADELGGLAVSLQHMSAQIRDLIGRVSLESARREAILSSMVEGVLAVDSDLRVIFCNEAFSRLVGAAAPPQPALPLMELVRDPALFSMLSDVLATGNSAKQRILMPAADGKAFEVQTAPLTTSTHRGALAILHDITDLERLERVRRDFVANVSHELRTPLTAIRGYAETLLDGALEDPHNNRRFVEIIQAHAHRLNTIAADLLTLSELDAGKSPGNGEPTDLSEPVESALRTVETEARLRQVRLLRGQIDAVSVRADRTRLEQMLVNLLDNGIKFNRPGGEVVIEVTLAAEGQALIQVSDNGIGIPSTDIPRIFERFYRVDKARSREVGGTGLGLSIVKHLAERMGGTVSVESQLGKGSKFTVVLPSC
jgi:two-component system, OmpR family, phosphate regulon sensor histidine kinase PhoR